MQLNPSRQKMPKNQYQHRHGNQSKSRMTVMNVQSPSYRESHWRSMIVMHHLKYTNVIFVRNRM